MRIPRTIAAAGLLVAAFAPTGVTAGPVVCSVGGSPTARTGTFTASPGIRNVPSSVPIELTAIGEIAGSDARCTGTLTARITLDAGASCLAFIESGTVEGVPGATGLKGGGGAYSRSVLLDADGNVVGAFDALARSRDQIPFTESCASEAGLTEGTFSSVTGLILGS